MENITEHRGFGWSYLILGIFFIIVAFIAFSHPLANLYAVAMLFGFLAIANGVWLILNRFVSIVRVVVGVLEILIGGVLLYFLDLTAWFVPYMFAAWFIVDSITNLFLLGYYRVLGKGYFWFTLIINVLGIGAGVLMLFSPLVSTLSLAFIVGFYLMLIGIEYIVIAFSNPELRIRIEEENYIDPNRRAIP